MKRKTPRAAQSFNAAEVALLQQLLNAHPRPANLDQPAMNSLRRKVAAMSAAIERQREEALTPTVD